MSIDNVTERSISSRSSDTSSSSARLDRSLRLAAETAGTSGIESDDDDDDDFSFVAPNHEIIGAFKPWVKKGNNTEFDAENMSSRFDQENVNPFNESQRRTSKAGVADESDMSMDITKSVGRIIPNDINHTPSNLAVVTPENESLENTVGHVQQLTSPSKDFDQDSEPNDDEEMTMEFTSVFGGVIGKDSNNNDNNQRYPEQPHYPSLYDPEETHSEAEEEDMDMTSAVGGILPPIEEHTEPSDNETMGMEMTNAIGKILPPFKMSRSRTSGLLDLSAVPDRLSSSPFQENTVPSPPKPALPQHSTITASENGSPLPARTRRSMNSRASSSPRKSYSRQSTPVRSPSTPVKQLSSRAPGPSTPTTPQGSPPTPRSATASPSKRSISHPSHVQVKSTPVSIFKQDQKTGQSTPSFVFRARGSRSSLSGYGIDKEGLGSPRVAEILDRRRSIGEDAQDFIPQPSSSRGVRFEDPRKLDEEVTAETQESGQESVSAGGVSFQEPEKDTTMNLRDMISSLTPKKNKFKGRKSLHVGAAKGLLGKRPVELDIEDEEEDPTPKRLRGREASPVKSIRLPAPPSKVETVGRTGRLSMRRMSPTTQVSTTPKQPYPFKEIHGTTTPRTPPLPEPSEEHGPEQEGFIPDDPEIKPIQLSEFLDMTRIHFMELTTTKRRHTLAPDSEQKRLIEDSRHGTPKEISFQDCVAAGFCTVPMLELYQHVSIIDLLPHFHLSANHHLVLPGT